MEGSSCSSGSENVLKHEIMAAGIKLCNPPSSVTDLLKLLGVMALFFFSGIVLFLMFYMYLHLFSIFLCR